MIFDDGDYADLCRTQPSRLAAADTLRRVIYDLEFSKTLAANLRVGFVACAQDIAGRTGRCEDPQRLHHARDQRAAGAQAAAGGAARHVRALCDRLGATDTTLRSLRRWR